MVYMFCLILKRNFNCTSWFAGQSIWLRKHTRTYKSSKACWLIPSWLNAHVLIRRNKLLILIWRKRSKLLFLEERSKLLNDRSGSHMGREIVSYLPSVWAGHIRALASLLFIGFGKILESSLNQFFLHFLSFTFILISSIIVNNGITLKCRNIFEIYELFLNWCTFLKFMNNCF